MKPEPTTAEMRSAALNAVAQTFPDAMDVVGNYLTRLKGENEALHETLHSAVGGVWTDYEAEKFDNGLLRWRVAVLEGEREGLDAEYDAVGMEGGFRTVAFLLLHIRNNHAATLGAKDSTIRFLRTRCETLERELREAREALEVGLDAVLLRTPRSVSCLLCRYPVRFDGRAIREHRGGCPVPIMSRAALAPAEGAGDGD